MSLQYTEKVMDHFTNPRNVGEIPNADGVGKVGNPVCGDVMYIYIKVKDNVLDDVKFKTFGCGSAIATSSMMTVLAKGLTVQQGLDLTRDEVAKALDGLPPQKMHCSNLAADGLHAAIHDYRRRIGEEPPLPEGAGEDDDHDHDLEADDCLFQPTAPITIQDETPKK